MCPFFLTVTRDKWQYFWDRTTVSKLHIVIRNALMFNTGLFDLCDNVVHVKLRALLFFLLDVCSMQNCCSEEVLHSSFSAGIQLGLFPRVFRVMSGVARTSRFDKETAYHAQMTAPRRQSLKGAHRRHRLAHCGPRRDRHRQLAPAETTCTLHDAHQTNEARY